MDAVEFRIGSIRCLAVHDGDVTYDTESYVANAPKEEVAIALAPHGHQPDAIPSPYTALAIQTAGRTILVDIGVGDLAPTTGHTLDNLEAAGIRREDVHIVVVTHAHPDHIGGNASGGEAAFPAARYLIWADEWAWWTDPTRLASMPTLFADAARRHLVPLEDRVEVVSREDEIAPGVRILATPGHTEGHIAVAVESGGERLLYISDAALQPIHLEHPDWHPVFDRDPELAAKSPRRLFDDAADQNTLVVAFHFPPFPSLGRVERRGRGWTWLPEAMGRAPN
jgi:glyoxylase-like metal-dependent hydrolase (beta-lactamase superfamily II)